jgi:hypothetical protein
MEHMLAHGLSVRSDTLEADVAPGDVQQGVICVSDMPRLFPCFRLCGAGDIRCDTYALVRRLDGRVFIAWEAAAKGGAKGFERPTAQFSLEQYVLDLVQRLQMMNSMASALVEEGASLLQNEVIMRLTHLGFMWLMQVGAARHEGFPALLSRPPEGSEPLDVLLVIEARAYGLLAMAVEAAPAPLVVLRAWDTARDVVASSQDEVPQVAAAATTVAAAADECVGRVKGTEGEDTCMTLCEFAARGAVAAAEDDEDNHEGGRGHTVDEERGKDDRAHKKDKVHHKKDKANHHHKKDKAHHYKKDKAHHKKDKDKDKATDKEQEDMAPKALKALKALKKDKEHRPPKKDKKHKAGKKESRMLVDDGGPVVCSDPKRAKTEEDKDDDDCGNAEDPEDWAASCLEC